MDRTKILLQTVLRGRSADGGALPEIADAVVFVASVKASYVIGQIIRVNGGKTTR